MHPRVTAELGQAGLVTRRFAIKAGMAPEEIDRLVRRGAWVRAWRGVYVLREVWDALDLHVGRPRMVARAASAHMYVPHVMSHDSAALELGIAVLDAPSQPVHVTRFGVVGTRHRHGVKHHKAPYGPEQLVLLPDGRAVLDAARTVVDIARERGLEAGVVAADSALQLGITREALLRAAEPMVSWPYILVVRRVIELADPGGESAGETLTRLLLIALGFAPTTQLGLTDGHRRVWCDLVVGRHVIEFDGRLKYTAEHGAEQALWDEKARQDFVTGFGLGMSRVVWADLFGQRRGETTRRLERQIRRTDELLGRDVADLAPFLIRTPRPRRRPDM